MAIDRPGQLLQIQALRGFAALCVVLTHAFLGAGWISNLPTMSAHPFLGEFGVDVFFVISGFIMVITTGSGFGHSGAQLAFLKKRIIRVVPLYWLLSGVLMGVIIFAPQLVALPAIDVLYWAKSLLFVPVAHPLEDGIRPVLVVGWTLQYEMFFYVLFALSMFFSRRTGLSLLLFSLVGFVAFGQFFGPQGVILHFFSEPIILEFAAGIVIGLLFTNNIKLPRATLWALPLLAAILLVFGWAASSQLNIDRVWFFGIPAAMLVAGLTLPYGASNIGIGKTWRRIGDSSYALYLSHVFVIAALGFLFNLVGPADWQQYRLLTVLFIASGTMFSLIVGWYIHFWLEKPMGQYITDRTKASTLPPVAAALSRQAIPGR